MNAAHGTDGIITQIEVYWDERDANNIGWAARWERIGVGQESDGVNVDPTSGLDTAIDQACWELGVPLNHDDFATEPNRDGGYAIWKSKG